MKQPDGQYNYHGATLEHLRLMRRHTTPHIQIKAAGGVRTLDDLLAVREIGVTRIGATATKSILNDALRRDSPAPCRSLTSTRPGRARRADTDTQTPCRISLPSIVPPPGHLAGRCVCPLSALRLKAAIAKLRLPEVRGVRPSGIWQPRHPRSPFFIFDAEGRVLLIRRGREPALGKWAPPGGFLDAGEYLEEAVVRETGEETGLVPGNIRYLASFPNAYVNEGLARPCL